MSLYTFSGRDIEDVTTFSGLEPAMIGVGSKMGQCDVAVYSREGIVKILMERDGMSREDADEFLEYNIAGLGLGDETPVIMEEVHDA